MAEANEISHARISSCFMHFEGVTEQLCQVSRQRLKKFIECRHKWAKLDCVQADIAKSSYNKFDDDFVNTYNVFGREHRKQLCSQMVPPYEMLQEILRRREDPKTREM